MLTATLAAQTSTPKSKAKAAPASRSTAMAKDIQALRETVAAQQQQMKAQRQQMNQLKSQLQQLLDATQQANASAQKLQGSAERAQTTAAQAQQSAVEAQRAADQASSSVAEAKTALAVVDKQTKDEGKRVSALQDVLGRFRLSGDIRVRGEDIFQDCAACVTRNRARLRVRFGVDGRLNENFVGGFALATDSSGDPDLCERIAEWFLRTQDHRPRPRVRNMGSEVTEQAIIFLKFGPYGTALQDVR